VYIGVVMGIISQVRQPARSSRSTGVIPSRLDEEGVDCREAGTMTLSTLAKGTSRGLVENGNEQTITG
jgi:hypothetical protein